MELEQNPGWAIFLSLLTPFAMNKAQLRRMERTRAHHQIKPIGPKPKDGAKATGWNADEKREKEKNKAPPPPPLELKELPDTVWPVSIKNDVLKNQYAIYVNEYRELRQACQFDRRLFIVIFKNAQECKSFMCGDLGSPEIPQKFLSLCDEFPKRGAFCGFAFAINTLIPIRSDSLHPSMNVKDKGRGVNRIPAAKKLCPKNGVLDPEKFMEIGLPPLRFSKGPCWEPGTGFTIFPILQDYTNPEEGEEKEGVVVYTLDDKGNSLLLPPTTRSPYNDECFCLEDAKNITSHLQLAALWRRNVVVVEGKPKVEKKKNKNNVETAEDNANNDDDENVQKGNKKNAEKRLMTSEDGNPNEENKVQELGEDLVHFDGDKIDISFKANRGSDPFSVLSIKGILNRIQHGPDDEDEDFDVFEDEDIAEEEEEEQEEEKEKKDNNKRHVRVEKKPFLHRNPDVAIRIASAGDANRMAKFICAEWRLWKETAPTELQLARVLNQALTKVEMKGGQLRVVDGSVYAVFPHVPIGFPDETNQIKLSDINTSIDFMQTSKNKISKTDSTKSFDTETKKKLRNFTLKAFAGFFIFIIFYGVIMSAISPKLLNFDFSGHSGAKTLTGDEGGELWPGGSPYNALGVSPSATNADIKKAYHRLSLEVHPDRCPVQRRGRGT